MVAVKVAVRPCSQTPTFDTPATAGKQATAGMLATARIPAATGRPGLSAAALELYLCDPDPLHPPPSPTTFLDEFEARANL